jgi:Big-like domain-containing protein
MNKRSLRWGCLSASLFIIVLLVIGGGWWFLRSQDGTAEAPSSLVQVFLLSPAGGDEFSVGDYLQVRAQAFAPKAIVRAELFVDGKSLGAATDSPETASWTWQAWPAGIHSLSVQATAADGQMGQSQTVILTVLEGDSIQSLAKEGQMLDQIGAEFGVPPDEMASANPHLDPARPLADGQPVQVPTGGGADSEGAGSGDGPAGAPIPDLIHWQFQATDPVDKFYCYTSFGDGIWYKMPKNPFDFFNGAEANYPQYGFPLNKEKGAIQAQCWGWLGGALKYLGEGETKFDPQQLPDKLILTSSGFKLVVIPPIQMTAGELIPPPYALREPSNKDECYQNHGLAAGFLCAFLDAKVKDKYVLVWEWQPPACWPGQNCITKIDGYRVYEIETNKSVKLLKEINNSAQKVAAVPMGWGTCFGVRAYINDPAAESKMITWCGEQPTPQIMTLTPTDWLTTGGKWIQDGDCDTYGGGDTYVIANKDTGFGNQAGEVMVGGLLVDDDGEDCFKQSDYSGGVKFKLPPALPPGAFIQKVVLKFSEVFTDYKVSGLATAIKPVCWSGVGTAIQDWTGLGDEKHFVGKNLLMGYVYGNKLVSLSEWNNAPQVDVTSIVNNWIKYPDQNYGFILYPAIIEGPYGDGFSICATGIGNVQLEIYYFAP